jgi:hypothetical protein
VKLDIRAMALAAGLLWGGALCFATLWLIVLGYEGTLLRQLDHFYLGYTVSVVGAFVGLVYGFVDGAIGGALLAWLYNRFAR